MIGDDDLDKKVEDYTLFYLMMKCVILRLGKQTSTTINDTFTGGTTGGSMALSGSKDSFVLNESSITATEGWNGAEYKRSFGRTAQDFKSTLKIHVNQKKKAQHMQHSIFTMQITVC